ncbi:MAG: hypothetical protein JRN46_02350 [Nitrososphaerota archaeon]|nr:hypothetical protein [Nitrososphaerota archaeon]
MNFPLRLAGNSGQRRGGRAPEWHPLPHRRLRCHRCGYEWETDSKLLLVTCPSCHYKVDSARNVVGDVSKKATRT